MAYVTRDQVDLLWRLSSSSTWNSLLSALDQVNPDSGQFSAASISQLKFAIEKLWQDGRDFPKNTQELTSLINQTLSS
jgi:hypothetical protein